MRAPISAPNRAPLVIASAAGQLTPPFNGEHRHRGEPVEAATRFFAALAGRYSPPVASYITATRSTPTPAPK